VLHFSECPRNHQLRRSRFIVPNVRLKFPIR
jgi:hypothetical protein